MPQKTEKILPKFLNTDVGLDSLNPDESPFLKGVETTSFNGNPDTGIGTGNPTGEGQNQLLLSPVRSNVKINEAILPAGINKNIGSFESIVTRELYYFNENSNGEIGIYVLSGDTGQWNKIVEDLNLQFTLDQDGFIADHRVTLRPILNKQGQVIEKILLLTDGKSWQKWILVNTGIATNGFDVSLFPYFALLPPHFDRRELLEWAVRPCMYNPTIVPLPNTPADTGKVNNLVDSSFEVAVAYNYTDGRPCTLSPYSEPIIINTTDFLNSPDRLPKNVEVTIYAGGAWVESIDVYVRQCSKQKAGIPSTITWGTWKYYDRIYGFANDPRVLETPFWLRQNKWVNNSYDATFNTIKYIFDNSKLGLLPLIDTSMLQNDLPQLSVAHSTLGDTESLANNRYGYDNLSSTQTGKLDVVVKEKAAVLCDKPIRKLTMYAYIGRAGQGRTFVSQVGYINGTDTMVRFGGLVPGVSGSNPQPDVDVFTNESIFYSLNFAGKKGLRLYLKGTPYFADCQWVIINSDNTITEIDREIDISSADVREYLQNVFKAGGYFAARFVLNVPADRYIATIGRHNVASTGDYRNTSTYIYGIANSRVKSATNVGGTNFISIKPNAIGSFSKEMEIDCTAGDVDVWGNGQDMFYIYCPYLEGTVKFRFFEGYFKESGTTLLPVELFPYGLTNFMDDGGQFTDKNGFYWAFTKNANSENTNIKFVAKVNCAYPTTFVIPTTQTGSGWMQNATAYLSDNNAGVIGDCNRVLLNGRITSLDGSVGYSNIAISIKDGSTVYTDTDGNFTLVVHNGQPVLRSSNVYINAGGNFRITVANCGQVPLSNFNESLSPCVNCQIRIYPIPLNMGVNAEGGSQYSLKENATYPVSLACADLAGRLQFPNPIKTLTVPSFLQRDNILATYFQAQLSGALQLEPDLKWAAFYVGRPTNIQHYFDWVADKLTYIDSNGNVVSDPATATFVAIYIDSLYNYNVANLFSVLASYQFTPQDRLRILDDGNGNLLDVATFGEPIDVQILGTNYNQAAQSAGIVPNVQNPIVNVNNTTLATSVTLFIRYDARLDRLIKDTGLWIEIYTPQQTTEKVPYKELKWYPVVNGEIAIFTGYNNGVPVYNYPITFDLNYWDTYLFNRTINIPDIGSKFFNHPFNSPNVTDNWGANLDSGGRENIANPNAKQLWYINDVIRSDTFTTGSSINGLGIFRDINRKDFSYYKWGAIIGMIAQRSIILFICENDFFTTNYQFHYAYPNTQGVMVVNIDNDLSTPFQKTGDHFGCNADDTGTILVYDKFVFWYDRKNAAWVICDYSSAKDVSDIVGQDGRKFGIKSYLLKKSEVIGNWNLTHSLKDRFDVIAGIDYAHKKIYITFRPRRNNSNADTSYISQRENIDVRYQETIVYDIEAGRWVGFSNFTPEGYGSLRGNQSGVEFFSFAAGLPYKHNNTPNNNYLNFYGVQTSPTITVSLNSMPETVKVLQDISLDILPNTLWVDMVYDNEENSFSYIPANMFKKKENNFYAAFLRDMVSYLSTDPAEAFRSSLVDGKRLFSRYFICRLTARLDKQNQYFQLSSIYYVFTNSVNSNKK